jgi:hypothetical protein
MDYLHFEIPSVVTSLYAGQVETSLSGTRILIGIWCLISTMEWVHNRNLFRKEGLLAWRILSLRPGFMFGSDWFHSLFWERSIAWLLNLRIAAAVGLILTPRAGWAAVALLVIIATSWFLTMRSWLGGDGSDEMGQIVSIGVLLIALGIWLNQLTLSFAGTLLIGGQLTISYFFAGFAKLLSAEWRQGRAMVGVTGTHIYGHALTARVFGGSAVLSKCFCWLVIISETLFPLFILAPPKIFLITVTAFFMFHLSHAYFMGLNTFVWAFAAAYPSVLLLNQLINVCIPLR